jgi:hypothetical protein
MMGRHGEESNGCCLQASHHDAFFQHFSGHNCVLTYFANTIVLHGLTPVCQTRFQTTAQKQAQKHEQNGESAPFTFKPRFACSSSSNPGLRVLYLSEYS